MIFTTNTVQNASVTSEQQRHRALADPNRARLLAELRHTRGALGIRELASSVGLHPNTTREHLDHLVRAGLVVREVAPPTGRGRPALRYRADHEAAGEDLQAYRSLAAVLARELADRPDGREAAVRAGERWGTGLAGGLAEAAAEDPVRRLVDIMDDLGFAPDALDGIEPTIRLRRCPFLALARERTDVVCGTHLGLMRGALRALDAPVDAESLEPFVAPNLCVAQLRPRSTPAP